MLTPFIAILAITVIGFIAQRIGLCMVSGTREAMQGRPGLLIAILLSGFWVWAYSIIALTNGWQLPFDRYAMHPLFALGGFTFGIGASINQACSISTMNHLTRGKVAMLFAIAGWFLGWYLWMTAASQSALSINYTRLPDLPLTALILIATPLFIATLAMLIIDRQHRYRWLGISVVGCLSGCLFYLVPNWTPSRLIQDSGSLLLGHGELPSLLRFALLGMLMFGMWLSVVFTRDVKLRWPTRHKIIRHSLAGTLMGIGGSMALGGNDAQLLTGLPAASIGGMTALVFMLLGIATEQTLYKKGALFYQKR